MDLFETFKANAEAAGAKVHVATDAQEANAIIAAIAQENNAKKSIKTCHDVI